MRCDQCRETVSAGLDREASADELTAAEAHLARCGACRAWTSEAERLGRQLRVRIADSIPDLSSAVVAAAGDLRHERRAGRGRNAVRIGLVAVAAAQLALALPELGGRDHAGNEAASWAVAAAVGLLTAAATPRRVLGMLPVLSVAALVLVLITFHDVVGGHVHVGHELPHGLLVAGVGLLWLLRDRDTGAPRRDEEVLAPRPARPGTARRVA
jgi:predicted anti-sigma-YlaC factor YlaD